MIEIFDTDERYSDGRIANGYYHLKFIGTVYYDTIWYAKFLFKNGNSLHLTVDCNKLELYECYILKVNWDGINPEAELTFIYNTTKHKMMT